ncbi:MAG: HD domain-containing protein [Syntrophomonadaceae bacterium]|jgi:tRNA nucleotidyltransferase (CCA-adding enzyme)|nr:HD domain-containing protein [Syntrophomonadaceae bacterium]
MQVKLPDHIEYVLNQLKIHGFQAVIVGGAVRDLLMNRIPRDFDVLCSARPAEVEKLFARTLPIGHKHGTTVVMVGDRRVEISSCRGFDSGDWDAMLKDDLLHRDFTVNAMAMDEEGNLIDPYGGRQDIARKLIRVPENRAEERFRDDPLRMLRAVRLAAVLDFELDASLLPAIEKCSALIESVSAERIREELIYILTSSHPAAGLRLMVETGLMQRIIPEVMAMVGFEQYNPAHVNDVFNHSLAVVENVPNKLEMRLAALLHDIGKPATFTMDSCGIGHFYHHQQESQRQTLEILKRLKFSRAVIDKVSILVGNHMYWLKKPDREGVARLLMQVGEDNLPDLFTLQKADITGSASFHDISFIDQAERIYQEMVASGLPLKLRDLAVNGYDLMEIGYQADAKLGQALQVLWEMVLTNLVENNQARLLAAARELLPTL